MIDWKAQRRPAKLRFLRLGTVHPRDLIVSGLTALLLLVFFAKAAQYSLIGNLQILASYMALIGIVAVGQTLVVLTGGIDLAVGSLVALTGVIIAYLITDSGPLSHVNPWLAAAIGLAAAGGIGWIHGLLISRYNLSPFIVTFGSLSLTRGLAQVISNASPINLKTTAFDWLWSNLFGLIPVPAIIMAIVFISAAYMLRNTRFGRYTYAMGSNETVARLSGINTGLVQQIIYAISGFLAGVAGLLLMTQIEGGMFNGAPNYELLTVAAVIIGGTSLKGGTGGVWGTLGGVLLMSMVNNGLVLFNVPPLWNQAIPGAIILIAALIDVQRKRLLVSTPAPLLLPMLPVEQQPHSLDQAIKQLSHTIEDRFGYSDLRVYLKDRESGALVEPSSHSAPVGTLAAQANAEGKPLHTSDLRRERNYQVAPLHPEIRSAAAVPIRCQSRIVGVVEVQSTSANGFSTSLLESLDAIGLQMGQTIEDYWLFEAGWLTQQVRESLRNLDDDVYLNQCPLAEWLRVDRLDNTAETLRQMLHDAIERVVPQHLEAQPRTVRRYQILKQTYLDQDPVESIIHNLGLSRRQYFYDLKQAIDSVTHYLFTARRRTEPKPPTPEKAG